jgi:hypothetical protein
MADRTEMSDEVKSQLQALEDALTEQLDAYEDEVRARLERLKDIQEAVGASAAVEAASTSATEKWYGVFDQFFYDGAR